MPGGIWVKALYDFVGEQAPELTFNVGALFELVDDTKDGWLLVTDATAAEGIVPSEYVEFLSPEELERMPQEARRPAEGEMPGLGKMNMRKTHIDAQFLAVHQQSGGGKADDAYDDDDDDNRRDARDGAAAAAHPPPIIASKPAGLVHGERETLWETTADHKSSSDDDDDRKGTAGGHARKPSTTSSGKKSLMLDREEGLAFRKSQQNLGSSVESLVSQEDSWENSELPAAKAQASDDSVNLGADPVAVLPAAPAAAIDERQAEIARMAERARLRALKSGGAAAVTSEPAKAVSRSRSQPNLLADATTAAPSSYAAAAPGTAAAAAVSGGDRASRAPVVIATAMYDFEPQRHDELLARKGDNLFLLAVSSTRDWFLAKHMSKTGEPGLVPSNYVKVTDVAAMDARASGGVLDLPTLKEWKSAKAKQSMIPLKAHDAAGGHSQDAQAGGKLRHSRTAPDLRASDVPATAASEAEAAYAKKKSMDGIMGGLRGFHIGKRPGYKSTPMGVNGGGAGGSVPLVTSARVPTYTQWKTTDTFTFRVNVSRERGIAHVLQRTYDDFHALHLAILTQYPVESGKSEGEGGRKRRVIPYLPAPVDKATAEITNRRRAEIDEYLHRLFSSKVPEHIRASPLIQNFFTPQQNGVTAQSDAPVAGIDFGPESAPLHPIYTDKIARSGMAADGSHFLGDSGHSIRSSRAPSHLTTSTKARETVLTHQAQQPHPFAAGNARENGFQSAHAAGSAVPASSVAADTSSPQVRIKIPDPRTNEMIALRLPLISTASELLRSIKAKLEVGGSGGAQLIKSVAYIDDEGDRVLILTEEDWRDAKEMAVRSAGRLNLYAN